MPDRSHFTRRWLVVLTAIFCCLLWGSAYPAIKTGYALLSIPADDTASQVLFAGYRFFGSGLLLLALATVTGKSLWSFSPRQWGQLALLGLMQTTLQYVFFYIGLAYASGVKAAIVNSTGTFFSVLLAHFIYRNDRMSAARSIGCILGFAGVVLVNLGRGPLNFDFTLMGEGFIAIAALVMAIALLYGKRLSQTIDPVVMTGQQLTLGGLVLIAIGSFSGGEVTGIGWHSGLLLGYLTALSATVFALWSFLLKHNPVGQVIPLQFLIPVFGALLSAYFLQETILEWKNLMALALVCWGIWLVTRPSGQQT
ncbi:DMT family transporter [Marinimicrobium sp. C2-29]|uniref:DMT family transporter n=1 Tax=Marinimicrobium sp. C2-29 TaxID=3139825 RepID=UPI0031387DF9